MTTVYLQFKDADLGELYVCVDRVLDIALPFVSLDQVET